MGKLVNYVTQLHQATSRAYIDRMVDEKVHCMLKAKEYESDYWDGDRRYGYGGYKLTVIKFGNSRKLDTSMPNS